MTVQDPKFREGARLIIDIIQPLPKVLRLVDSESKPQMGYMYNVIQVAKNEIKAVCLKSYKSFWKFIDSR